MPKRGEVGVSIGFINSTDSVKFNFQPPTNVPKIVVDSAPQLSPDSSTPKFSFDLPMLGVSPSTSDVDMGEDMPGGYHVHRRPRRTRSSRGLLSPLGTRPSALPRLAEAQISRSRQSSLSSRAPSPDLPNGSLGRRSRSPQSRTPLIVVKTRLVEQKDVRKEEMIKKMQKQLGNQNPTSIERGEDFQKDIHNVHVCSAEVTTGGEGLAVTNESSTTWKAIIEMKDRELKRISGDLAEAEMMLKANEANLAKTNQALQEQGDEVARLNDGLRQRDHDLLKMGQDMGVLRLEIAEKDNGIMALSAEVAAQRKDAEIMLQANEENLAKANQTLQEQGDELTRLTDGLRHRDNDLLKMGQEMGDLRLEIVKRDEEIVTLGAEVTARRKEAHKMAEEVECLKQAHKERQEERISLENKVHFGLQRLMWSFLLNFSDGDHDDDYGRDERRDE